MKNIFILTEKSDAGCQVAEALYNLGVKEGDFKSKASLIKSESGKKGYLEGGGYTISWTEGHIARDMKPSEINPTYSLGFSFDPSFDYTMPTLKNEMKRVVKPERKKTASLIKSLISKNKFETVYICTDADAEGERIAEDALFVFGGLDRRTDIRRMWVSGAFSTPKVIKEQLENALPYDNNKYKWLLDTQKARADGDFLQGMKPTKCLVDVYSAKLYCGRVKNTIIGLVGDRELEIKNFVPKTFYTINGLLGEVTLNHFFIENVEDVNSKGEVVSKKERATQYFDKARMDSVIKDLEAHDLKGVVTNLSTKSSSTAERPLPLSGDDFKSIMAKKHGLSLEEAGNILQYLRDEGFTTYQGTNGRYFSEDEEAIVKTAYESALAYFRDDEKVVSPAFTLKAGLFNKEKAKKQNHPPLHLTDKVPNERDLEKWEKSKFKKVKEGYELIAKRILVHFLEADLFDTIKLEIEVNSHKFDTTGVKPRKQGWRDFIGEKKPDTFFTIPLKEGDEMQLDKYVVAEKETLKPKNYSEEEILGTLMNVSKVLNNQIREETDPEKILSLKKAKNILKDVEGIGTDRTREPILKDMSEALLNYSKKEITLKEEGWTLYEALPVQLRNVLFTAAWEADFEQIRRGELGYDEFILKTESHLEHSIKYIISNIDKTKVKVKKKTVLEATGFVCPVCSSAIMDAGSVFRCEKNLYRGGKQSGCKFSVFKNQDKLEARLNNKLFERLLGGEILTAPNGNQIHLDLENKYFTKIIYKEAAGGELVETPKSFRLGAKFCFKVCFGKELSKAEALKLLAGKEVELTRISKKTKKPYSVTVWVEDNGTFGSSFG